MATLSLDDIHLKLVDACRDGDLNGILSLFYFYKGNVEKLIKGDVAFYKTKFGEHKPGDYVYIASEKNFPEIVTQLLKLGASATQVHRTKMTPLLVACQKGNLEILEILYTHSIELHPAGVPFKDTPIYYSCRYGHANLLTFIVEKVPGILMKVTEGEIGTSPGIDYADIWGGLSKAAKSKGSLLIGNLLLYVGCILKHINVVKFLVNKGIAVQGLLPEQTFYSAMQSPLSAACRNSDYDMAVFLLSQKAEIISSIADQYPEFTALLLEDGMKKYRRSYSVKEMTHLAESRSAHPSSVYWDTKGLHKVHRHWLEVYADKICLLDIHDNKIVDLPSDFFELLPHLEDLDISCNIIWALPSKGLEKSTLTRIMACRNKLTALPLNLFLNKNICIIDVSQNMIRHFPPESENGGSEMRNWDCPSLKQLKCANNVLCSVPKSISGASGLERLILASNMLTDFSVTWKCPLNELDLSKNQLTEFSCMAQMVWCKSLQRLLLCNNNLKAIPSNITHLQFLQHLDVSHNMLVTLPPPSNWKCKVLSKLNLSHNMLNASYGPDGFIGVDKGKVADAIDGSNQPTFSSNCEFPVDIFENSLQSLDLSHNVLEQVPESICFLINLSELDLSCNPTLSKLPPEIGNLKNIWNLRLTDLNISDIPFQLDGKNHAKTVLPHLRAKLRKSIPFNRMKLMVVGLQGRGKTTLIATLQGKKPPPNISTVGISVEQWSLSSPGKSYVGSFFRDANESRDIMFSSWDLAGQHVYYATHQCFLTGKTLYLVVFNATHGHEGISSLAPWLLNIQARAPNSRVIIVGSHIDSLPSSNRKSVLDRMEHEILYKYDKKGFPLISGCVFISNTNGEGLSQLREKIYTVADQMNRNNGNQSMGKLAPLSYIELYDRIVKESLSRKEFQLPPVLTMDEMLMLAQSNQNNDIFDTEELVAACKFLHEHGILLHFNDHLRELNTLFFIDPSWLCDMLSLVVTVREKNPFIMGGYIKKNDLMIVLRNPRLPEKFIPQYLRLLERFEIALCIDDSTFLIPSMLPKERPGLTMENAVAKYMVEKKLGDAKELQEQYINRNYHMSYIPSGFWSRLIARIIIAVHKWGMIVTDLEQEKTHSKPPDDEQQYSMVFWREGILVFYDDGYFLIESFHDADIQYEDYNNEGVAISVWSRDRDFSAMGFIVDHLDMLMGEWYPGLEDVDEYGLPLVRKLVPCPLCSLTRQKELDGFNVTIGALKENFGAYFRDPHHVQQFDLQVCALAATRYEAISCLKHPSQPVRLELVVPDLLLTDLPSHFVIDPTEFEFEPSDLTKLGEGGAGGVYRGEYQGKTVAVKQFHSATKTRYTDMSTYTDSGGTIFVPTEQSVQDQIEDGKVIRAFWDLRQEVAVLCRLQHPNVIRFIGVCHSPLCFALELAPMGSLQTVLEKQRVERESKSQGVPVLGALLGNVMTHRIALQVAQALFYLHDSEIIYRDLKSDNVLVWSLDENDVVNVKISDYGISAFATPQGVIGEGGTPGFQAPEVKVGCAYDEKVDIFSYGIWLYEVTSGYRPFREYRTAAEIKKAIGRGLRPVLQKDGIALCMPFMELLMQDCWQSNPIYRPSSDELVSRLEAADMRALANTFPNLESSDLEGVTCVSLLPQIVTRKDSSDLENGSTPLMVWCDRDISRSFKIVDVTKETIQTSVACPGPRVYCATCVEDFIWLGTEGKQIEVFGTLGSIQLSILWTFPVDDHVTHMLTYETKLVKKLFASLANGTLLVFSKKIEDDEKKMLFNEEIDDVLLNEKEKWSQPVVVNLATQGLPAKCMTFTMKYSELWIGSGNMIVVVNPDTLEIIEKMKALKLPRSLIACMASDGEFVWLSDRKSSVILQWHVASRSKVLRLQCNMENPLNEKILLDVDQDELSSNSFDDITPDFSTRVVSDDIIKENICEEHFSAQVTTEENETEHAVFHESAKPKPHESDKKEDCVPEEAEPASSPDETGNMSQNTMSIPIPTQNAAKLSPKVRTRVFSGLMGKVKGAVKRRPSDTSTTMHSTSPGKNTRTDFVKPRSWSEESPSNLANALPLSKSPEKGNSSKLPTAELDLMTPSKLLKKLTMRKKPSLMFSKRSSKNSGKKYKPINDYISQEAKDEAVSRPRASAWSGSLDRVTALVYVNGSLWVGRASGDILVINVNHQLNHDEVEKKGEVAPRLSSVENLIEHNEYFGKVIAVLGTQLKLLSSYSRSVASLVSVTSDRIISLVRMEQKQGARVHSFSLPSKRNVSRSSRFDRFQLLFYNAWSLEDFDNFNASITELKNTITNNTE